MRYLLALPLVAAACAVPADDVSTDTAEIHGEGWRYATQKYVDRAIHLDSNDTGNAGWICTATRIAHRWALTAAHCVVEEGDIVRLYDGATRTGTRGARVVDVIKPDGLDPDCGVVDDTGSCDDGEGNHADMALLELEALDSEAELDSPSAVLAWNFPGEVKGWQVGNGEHGGVANPFGYLRMIEGEIDSDQSGGWFETVDDFTDGGDSGGPFYVNDKIVGTLTGSWNNWWNIYTAVPFRIEWILSTIDYQWLGAPTRSDHLYSGTPIDFISNTTIRTCQYACANTPTCEAFNYNNQSDQCQLVDSVTTSTTSGASHWYSALKHAGPTGFAGDTVGYVRADKRNVVVHLKHENGSPTDNRVREIAQMNGPPYWQSYDLTQEAPGPAAGVKVSAYRRSDEADAVVYRSDNSNRIVQLKRTSNGWSWTTLPDGDGTPAGSPVGMVRTDGVNAVYYRTQAGHVRELSLGTDGNWHTFDLTDATSAPLVGGDVSAYRRSDGYTAVVYNSTSNTIVELYKRPGDPWGTSTISNTQNGVAPAAASRPHGYVHANGYNAVVYRTTDSRIVELWLGSDGWHHTALPSATNPHGDPFAYVRADAKEAIVSRRSSGLLMQIAQGTNGWAWSNLSDIGNPNLYNAPTAYLRTDDYNSVLYEDSNYDDVIEVFYRKGDASWGYGNLSGTEP